MNSWVYYIIYLVLLIKNSIRYDLLLVSNQVVCRKKSHHNSLGILTVVLILSAMAILSSFAIRMYAEYTSSKKMTEALEYAKSIKAEVTITTSSQGGAAFNVIPGMDAWFVRLLDGTATTIKITPKSAVPQYWQKSGRSARNLLQ